MPRFPIQVPRSAMPRLLPPRQLNPTWQQPPVAPIHLSSSIVMHSGASDAPPISAFKNPMGTDMEILEVKFELSTPIPTGNNIAIALGGTISCQMVMGAFKLTSGSVPVWGFGRAENLESENKLDNNTNKQFSAYTWRLPKPLYVPAAAVVAPSFVHTGFLPNTINVRIGYSGRVCLQKPSVAYIPWVSGWTSKAFNPIENAGVDQSTELDLLNDSGRELRLQRFTGRTLYIDPTGFSSEFKPESFGSRDLTMRMIDSYGRPYVRTNTPFRSVFSALTRSWDLDEVGARLDPGGYVRVFLKKAASSVAAAGASGQAFVSMVGWREEPV